MVLTSLGAQTAMLGTKEKQDLAKKLLTGEKNINLYTSGICYDAAAFVRYLLHANITPDELVRISGQSWRNKFKFERGKKWTRDSIPKGTAIGFYRLIDRQIFHAAIAVGGFYIRAVNGGQLGAGWQHQVNLIRVLGWRPDEDGAFTYDGTKIFVYLSNL